MVSLIIPTFNRPAYVKQCFDSLQRADLPKGLNILLVDDCSTDNETIELFNSFTIPDITIERYRYEKNTGIKNVLLFAFDHCFANGADTCINLDSDAIVKSDFVQKLLALHKSHNGIVSGFNCDHHKNPVLTEGTTYVFRQHCNGINMCMNKAQYEAHVRPALKSNGNWDFNSTNKQPFAITKPSVVQHIGMQSSMGHNDNPDVACDFHNLHLPDVTLFGIDAHDPQGIVRAAEISTRDILFGDVQIITERLFSGREAYSKFCIKDMAKYIKTSHVLIIHPDGFIVNDKAWDNDWLKYDYIGAKWLYHDGMAVGNGGFSLRSKRLLDIISKLDVPNPHPEDSVICRDLRPMLERKHGIKFAPIEVADKFSIEAYGCHVMTDGQGVSANQYTGQFGFHGYSVKGLPIQPAAKRIQQNNINNAYLNRTLLNGRKIK